MVLTRTHFCGQEEPRVWGPEIQTDAKESPGTVRDAEGDEKELRGERHHCGGALGNFSQISGARGPS